MKKKYTLQLIDMQMRFNYLKVFNFLKKNVKFNYKKIVFVKLKYAVQKSKTELFLKEKMFKDCFCKATKLKNAFSIIRLQTKQKTARRNIAMSYNIHFVQKNYIQFFKNCCIMLSHKGRRMQKFKKIEEYYLINLAKKTLKALYVNMLSSQYQKMISIRKFLISKIFFQNLKELYYFNKNKTLYYRILHLKKYYFGRLRRTLKLEKLNLLARVKFLSKFWLLWTKAILINRKSRIEGIYLFNKVLYKLYLKINFLLKHFFFSQIKKKYFSVLKGEVNTIKMIKFQRYKCRKTKMMVFRELRNHKKVNIHLRKKEFKLKKNIIQVMKFIKDISIPIYLKEEEADAKLRQKMIKKYFKIFFLYLKKQVKITKRKIIFFRTLRIWRFLVRFTANSKRKNNKIITAFRRYFLLYNFFEMMKMNSLIVYRENKILAKIQKKIARMRKTYLYWAVYSLKLNMLCEKYIKMRKLKIKIKIFYALKMMSN